MIFTISWFWICSLRVGLQMQPNGELPAVCLFDQVGASKSSITALQAFEQDRVMLGNVSFSGATCKDQTIVVYRRNYLWRCNRVVVKHVPVDRAACWSQQTINLFGNSSSFQWWEEFPCKVPPPDLLNYKSTRLIQVGYQRNATETISEGDLGNLPDLDFPAAYFLSPYNKLTIITYRIIVFLFYILVGDGKNS